MFYEKGLNFTCKRCSACCRLSPGVVYLSRQDLTNLCLEFNLKDTEFVEKYCRWVMYYDGEYVLSLQETKEYDCILWSTEGCRAYKGRPVQCSTYPFWSWMLADRQQWDECAKDCPGMNNGQLRTFGEIEEQCKLYDSIVPLKKRDFDLEQGI
ncbi:MAG: YkgJ family cysteine cluster protein [Treponema sp.]|nr:YkgJ family cysteine cluster protein [Treponema sp.]